MNISDYQVHQVLKLFSRQLFQNHIESDDHQSPQKEDDILRQLRHDLIVEKITAKIFHRIVQLNSSQNQVGGVMTIYEDNVNKQVAANADFFYALIEPGNNVKLCQFSPNHRLNESRR